MNKLFPIFFMILGVADFSYGLYSGDRISILIGGIMIFIGFSIMRKNSVKEKEQSLEKKPQNEK
ncbi:MAG: SoxR reducing system RseC family protein [Thermodesulfobacteriota bacterium]|nr:SoxR reducing system RseC family protein [Thermodesulfobacteriota bacterium]